MNKRRLLLSTIITLLSVTGAAFAQLTTAPTPYAAYVSADGGATWDPYTGVGTGTPLPNAPTPIGMYCSSDGGATWLPCSFGGGGGGSGTVTNVAWGTNAGLGALFTCTVASPTISATINCTLASVAQNSILAGPPSGGAGTWSFQTAPTFAVTNLTGTGGFNTTGTAGGLSADIAESRVTGLVSDLAARPIGSPIANSAVQVGIGVGVIGDSCVDALINMDSGRCGFTITGKGLPATGTPPTVRGFARFTNDALTAAVSGDPATSSALVLVGVSHVVNAVTYFLSCSPGSVCPATFTNTAVDGQSVEYDPATQLAKSVATCTPGNWIFGKTDGSGNVFSQPHRCPYAVTVNTAALTTPTSSNFENSITNSVGLAITFSNPSGNNVLAEITGGAYTGTAANLSGTPALPNGTTGTTQAPGDNTTKLATDAFVLANGGGTNNGTPMLGSSNFSALTVSTNYIYLQGSGNSSTTQVQKETVMSGPGTFQNLSVLCIGTTTGTMTITLQKASAGGTPADTSLSVVVNAGCTAGTQVSDTNAGHNVTVVAGDVLDYKVVQSVATATNATVAYPSVLFK